MAKSGGKVEVIQLSPDVRKAMYDAAQPAVKKIIADLSTGGVKDAQAVYDAINK